MPGGLWNNFRQGNRTEYLAAYLLSALGIAVKVPREEDVGIDFHCNLASDFGSGLLQFFAPYNVQIKSVSNGSEEISYGGVKDGKCKIHEVRWLLSQRTPFFLGLVNKKIGEIRLYSMANRWFAKYEEQVPCELVFVTDTLAAGEELRIESIGKTPMAHTSIPAEVASCSWKIPLGPPVMTLNVEEAEDACSLVNKRSNFKDYIYLDEKNGVFAGMNLPAFSWPYTISPNESLMQNGFAVGWNKNIGHHTNQQMQVLASLVASMQRTYVITGNTEEAQKLGDLLSIIPQEDYFKLVVDMIKDSNNMIGQPPSIQSTSLPSLSSTFL
jgi:hypothetical protein